MADFDRLGQSIENLFLGRGTQEANLFIQKFSESKECWASALTLLGCAKSHIAYFSANILYNKVRKNWAQLSDVEKQELFFVLVEKVRSHSAAPPTNDEKTFIDRLILTLCGVCIRIPNGLATYFSTAMQMINAAQNEQQALVGLSMITIVPEEVEGADVSRNVRMELTEQLHSSADQFAQLADRYSTQARDLRELFLTLLKLVRAWLSCGMTLSKLFLDHRPTFDLICIGASSNDTEVVTQSCAVIKEIVSSKEYPRVSARTEALKVLTLNFLDVSVLGILRALDANYVHTAEYRIERLLTTESYEIDVDAPIGILCLEYCSTYTAIASSSAEGELLCTGFPDPAINTRETDMLVGFHSALMGMIGMKPRKMAFSTFDFWAEFGDYTPAEWHPYVREDVLYELFCVVVCHSTYPSASVRWSMSERDYSEDQEDFVAFRDTRLGICDTIGQCMGALAEKFFNILQMKFEQFERDSSRWMSLEVVLYLMHGCVDAIKDIVMKLTYQNKAYQQSILQFIYNVTYCVLSIPADYYASNRALPLYQAACRFLGSLTFLFTSTVNDRPVMQLNNAYVQEKSSRGNFSGNNTTATTSPRAGIVYISDFYYAALRSVVAAVDCGHSATAADAARAVHKLCIHGCKKLTASLGDTSCEGWQTLLLVVQSTSTYIQSSTIEAATVMILVESCTRCVMDIPTVDAKSQLLGMMGESIVAALQVELSRPASVVDDVRVVNLLSFASQLIRFSDVPTPADGDASPSSTHPLLPFLAAFWPILQQISSDPRANIFPAVNSAMFQIFGKVLMSVGSAVFGEIPNMTNAILGATGNRCGSAGAALSCAQVLVESLCRHAQRESASGDVSINQQSREHLLRVFVTITDQYALHEGFAALQNKPASAGSSAECMMLFGQAYDAMEQYFSFVHTYLLFCRGDFLDSGSLLSEKVLGLCCVCLTHCTERDPLRSLMHAMQVLLVPTSRDSAEMAPQQAPQLPVLQALAQYGSKTTLLLLQLVNDARIPTSLVPNLTETLYCLIIACDTPIPGTPSNQHQNLSVECQQWVETAVMSPTLFAPLVELTQRQVLIHALLSLASSRSRRFKSLIQDLHKVCGSELTVDTLLAYA